MELRTFTDSKERDDLFRRGESISVSGNSLITSFSVPFCDGCLRVGGSPVLSQDSLGKGRLYPPVESRVSLRMELRTVSDPEEGDDWTWS